MSGELPKDIQKNAEILCLLAKAKPKVIKKLISTADKSLIRSISSCSSNILKGKVKLDPKQKKKLARYKNIIRRVAAKKTPFESKKSMLMKGGSLVAALLGTVAPMIIQTVLPSLVNKISSAGQ